MRLTATLLLAASLASVTAASAQRNYNLELLSKVPWSTVGERGNDCWGYHTAEGLEYALIGSNLATYIYSLEDPAAPVLRARIPGARSVWRDIKTYGEYAYVVADEGSDGLLVIDLSAAPQTITHEFYRPVANGVEILQAHNLYITEEGLLILAGASPGGGQPKFFDLKQSATAPPFVGEARPVYAHDVYAQEGRLYSSDLGQGLGVHDYTDLDNISVLGSRETSSDFTHNAWANAQGFAFTTDERAQSSVDAYDASDPTAIRLLDRFRPDESFSSGSIPHNTHLRGDYLITSWYTDGVVITDATRPHNLIQVGQYDTYPEGGGNGFNGNWGAFPFLPSGRVIASDIENGLFVFDATYEPGCYFEGTVQDSLTGELLAGVTVDLDGRAAQRVVTGVSGEYATGLYDEGAYDVTFSKPGYLSRTVTTQLRRGRLDFRNIRLQAIAENTFAIEAFDADGAPLSNLAIETIFRGIDGTQNRYDIYVAKWGFLPHIITDTLLPQGSNVPLTLMLARGYADDFTADLGWESTGTARAGLWNRGVPTETVFNDTIVQLGRDVEGDFGDKAYGTDVEAGSVADRDVDGGTAILTSPPFDLRAGEDARVSFAYSFAVRSGSTARDDTLLVELVLPNGASVAFLRTAENTLDDYRRFRSPPLRGLINAGDEPLPGLRIRVTTSDEARTGHLVEALFDDFAVGNVVGPALNASTSAACAGETVTFTLSDALPDGIVEADGATDVSFDGSIITATYPTAGTYGVRITTTDPDGQTVTYRYPDVVTVSNAPVAEFSFALRDSAVVDFLSFATDVTDLTWDFGDGTGSTTERPTHRYDAPGTYTVTLTARSACGESVTQQTVTIAVVSVEALARETGLRLLGNPVTETLALDYEGDGPVDVVLSDLSGRGVLSQKLAGPGRHTIDVSALVPGVYFLQVPSQGDSAAAVVVQR